MRSLIMARILFAVTLLAASLAGCAGPAPAPVSPTVDQAPTVAAIQTEAVETAVAAMTQNAPTAAPVVITNTPEPSATTAPTDTPAATETPAATNTPLPTATNTLRPWTATPADTATSVSYNCSITEKSPKSGDPLLPKADFDGRWVVKNTSSQIWYASEVDIRYASGTKFQRDVDAIDLNSDIAKNESITVIIDMVAPSATGTYSTNWVIASGSKIYCVLPLTITVKQ